MKPEFVQELRCPSCAADLTARVTSSDEREARFGELQCRGCARTFLLSEGIADFLDTADEALRREVEGWHQLAGPLGDGLIPTMTALPCYPHAPWIHVAPDFFQLFEHVDFAGKRVVDIGSGRTWSSRFLATLGRARQVVAVDVLTRKYLGLETADVYFREDQIFFERLRADVHRLPLPDGWADAVVSVAAVHHSGDLDRLFASVARVLRPSGLFAMVGEPVKKASIPERQPQNEETAAGINEHIYSYAEYLTALRRAGFRVRLLSPRTVRYRSLYPDPDFYEGLHGALHRLTRTRLGRSALTVLLGSRISARWIYRHSSLPLSLLAERVP